MTKKSRWNLLRAIFDMKIQYKIGSGFLICALLFLGNYVMIKYIQGIENKAGDLIIDIADRNAMLSQKIAVESESLFRGNEQIKETLAKDIILHEKSLQVLKKGGEDPGLTSNIILPPAPDEILPTINEAEDFWNKYKANAEKILASANTREAKSFISQNYSEMLKRDDELVKAFSNYFSEDKISNTKIITTLTDVAGRNRMLSQRIGLISMRKFVEQVSAEDEEDLRRAILLHDQSLTVMKEGGVPPGMEKAIMLPPAPIGLLATITRVDELWDKYKESAETLLNESENIKAIEFIETGYPTMLNHHAKLVKVYSSYLEKQKAEIVGQLNYYLVLILLFNLIMAAGAIWLTWVLVAKPLTNLSNIVDAVSDGDLSQQLSYENKDEIGKASDSVNKLISNQKKAADFAVHIGDGKFEDEFTPASENDTLGISLINMRDKLRAIAIEDKKRNWTTEGLAKFGETLRLNNDDIQTLSNEIISNLVKYLKANQGGLFIINDTYPSDTHLELISCYAFERKKHITKKIIMGEGLVGQAWQEGEYIYLTDVPDNYVHITSGLGEANPRSILIMPLKVNEKIFGILEIASFNPFEIYEIEFVQKISESIASTISTAKINERTKKLLQESQQQSEELKAQEEEMRQNMEEMTATQEEMHRKEAELQNMLEHSKTQEEELRKNMEEISAQQNTKEKEIEELLRIVTRGAMVSKTDLRGDIIYANDEFCKAAKYTQQELIGKNHNIVYHPDMPGEAFEDLWKTINGGKKWKGSIKNKAKDGSPFWLDTTIAPILDEDQKPIEHVAVHYLITDFKKQEEELIELKREIESKKVN